MGQERTNGLILLVEDNEDDAELTLRALKRAGSRNRIHRVRDGQEALDFLFGNAEYTGRDLRDAPIVVLLDIRLPKVNGLEVLERLRADARTRTIPVVMLTSSVEQRDLLTAYAHFANSYIRKPVGFESLVETLQQIGFYWIALNEAPPAPVT